MKRTQMTRSERDLISKLAKMCAYSEYVHANLVTMERVCGNKNCRCIREGKKHRSLYLVTVKKDGARKMIYIPRRLEQKTKEMVQRYFRIKETIERISDINLERLLKEKCLEE
ncbi:MAG: hypothetical protein M1371_00010 [Actinobacteria bacterium]|nr:hypothetical protein [Actinomycetota bacterium]